MKQENKELLLKDLCARLPYGVICDIYNAHCTIKERLVFSGFTRFVDDTICVRPYLFPLSSMTEEQKKELKNEVCPDGTGYFNEESLICPATHIGDRIPFKFMLKIIDWLNKNHFDINGLIPMGLAIDATNLNIYKL